MARRSSSARRWRFSVPAKRLLTSVIAHLSFAWKPPTAGPGANPAPARAPVGATRTRSRAPSSGRWRRADTGGTPGCSRRARRTARSDRWRRAGRPPARASPAAGPRTSAVVSPVPKKPVSRSLSLGRIVRSNRIRLASRSSSSGTPSRDVRASADAAGRNAATSGRAFVSSESAAVTVGCSARTVAATCPDGARNAMSSVSALASVSLSCGATCATVASVCGARANSRRRSVARFAVTCNTAAVPLTRRSIRRGGVSSASTASAVELTSTRRSRSASSPRTARRPRVSTGALSVTARRARAGVFASDSAAASSDGSVCRPLRAPPRTTLVRSSSST